MLTANERRVLAAARETVAGLGWSEAHTVASAAMDAAGRIHTGVDVHHFTGGPCAELVVMGQSAAVSGEALLAITAVGDGDRGVLAPCGRCRQVLLDMHPDATVLVPGPDGPETEPVPLAVADLLPHGCRQPDVGATRILHFAARYYEDVVAGRKTVTVRHADPHRPGPVTMVFEDPEVEGVRMLHGAIETVEQRRVGELTAEDVRRENLPDLDSLRRVLRTHYPLITDDDQVDVLGIRTR
ncbi:ASCH domain-containing protein [Nesterenkonia sp. F]|uniref:ASCH domain-containing protein n=1 Tax=Nesterenkonia sp. F TaxID=795955 RepID=UPI000255CB12|nr:ASCH domain-containing protein [Nesterenkonia sp. F]